VADEFLPTIEALLDRPEPPDHIVIETSGLALPKPLVQAFNWPEVRTRLTVDGVVAVVDGPAVAAGLFADDPAAVDAQRAGDDNLDHESPLAELFEDQLLCADMVILNKTDLMDDEAVRRVRANVIAEARDAVRIVPASHGAVETEVLLGIAAAAEDDIESRRSHHDGEDGHEHDDFESFVVEIGVVGQAGELAARVEGAMREFNILRVKGFAVVAGKDMRLVVQGVGPRVQHYFDRAWRAGEVPAGRLVVIGEAGLDQAAISAALQG
jgi:cobalamin biosynthesis protein CobW